MERVKVEGSAMVHVCILHLPRAQKILFETQRGYCDSSLVDFDDTYLLQAGFFFRRSELTKKVHGRRQHMTCNDDDVCSLPNRSL